ncbi:anaerobic ribonucleoside-triphosphate reductase-activating protein [Vibrio phage TCU-VP03-AIR1]
MKYQKINEFDFANGEGVRLSIFVSGCEHRCAGCYNESTWDSNDGIDFTEETLRDVLTSLEQHDGLSLTGGDPLYPSNREAILRICKAVKERYPDKDIWMWSGYKLSHVYHLEIMNYIDVFIDGRYKRHQPTQKAWRGSDNQILYVRVNDELVIDEERN